MTYEIMPKKKWTLGKTRVFKLKLYDETARRYQQILAIKNKTMQKDFEDYVNKVLSQ